MIGPQLDIFQSEVGSKLASIDFLDTAPFPVKRVFIIMDGKRGETRGRHAHLECWQGLIVLQGKLSLTTTSLQDKRPIHRIMTKDCSIHILPPLTWVEIQIHEENSIVLVLASHNYSESDYIRSHSEFLSMNL
jgi:hypothetical protein